MNLKGKTIVLGITGGIAAYKMPNVAHALVKLGADVHVLMTNNATEFIAPLVFETLTNRRCIVDTFDRNFQYDVAHVSLANAADLMLIAPATANVIAKMAHGQADDMLTTVTLAAHCPKLVAPAMTSKRWSITGSRSFRPGPACWPAATWALAVCQRRACWSTTCCASWPARRTLRAKRWSFRPVRPRSRWTPCAT